MRTFHARLTQDRAVSPIVAVLLLLAITVVLASVMYVTVSQMIPSTPENPRPLGVVLDRAGDNWILEIAVVSSGVSPSSVYLQVSDPNGSRILQFTPLADLTGFQDYDPKGVLNAGDRVVLPLLTYPEGCSFVFKDNQRILFNGVLRI